MKVVAKINRASQTISALFQQQGRGRGRRHVSFKTGRGRGEGRGFMWERESEGEGRGRGRAPVDVSGYITGFVDTGRQLEQIWRLSPARIEEKTRESAREREQEREVWFAVLNRMRVVTCAYRCIERGRESERAREEGERD